MNIKLVVNEEFDKFVDEIITTNSSIQTYPYEKDPNSEGRYFINVDDDIKNVHVIYQVSFSRTGTEEENAYEIAFKLKNGDYNDINGFGIQFRILATISKIVKDLMSVYNPNILRFQPIKAEGEKGNRRLNLYMQYVKGGAGEDFDAFIIGNNYKVSVEKRHPSFPLEGEYVDQETIQDIVTQLTVYNGYYETDVVKTDPDYARFSMSDYGDCRINTPNNTKSMISIRKFVDIMFNTPLVRYVQGSKEPNPIYTTPQPAQVAGSPDAPIQRVSRQQSGDGVMAGTFAHFLQSQVYGNPAYDILDPYFETMKSLNDFEELKQKAKFALNNARTTIDRERLLGIIDAVDSMKNLYRQYSGGYGRNNPVNEILNELEENLKELLNENIEEQNLNKKGIRAILDTDKAYAILDSSKAEGNTWCAGGCAILAYALNIAYGYPIYVIYNHDDKQVEHFGVRTPNNTFIDCDGEQREWLKNFRRKDFYLNPEKKLSVLPLYHPEDLNLTDIVIDMEASQQLAELIKSNGDLNEEEDYQTGHQAPRPSSDDAPMYDVTPMYGEDIYGNDAVRMFGGYGAYDNYSVALIQHARNKPNMQVKIYRAVPKVITNQEKIDDYQKRMKYILKTGKLPRDVDNWRNSSEYYDWLSTELERLKTQPTGEKTKINDGDWVTINPMYAKIHGQGNLGNKYKVLTKTVRASQLYTDGNSIHEWGYSDKPSTGINEEILNEKTYKVYHGTNQQFSKFNFKNATQGIVWFTDSIDSIKAGEHGGMGNKFIMTRYITINNPAGWNEYEKYGLGQLESMGYDGVILPQDNKTDYFVFSPKSISAKPFVNENSDNINVKELQKQLWKLDNWFGNNGYGTVGYKDWDIKVEEANSIRRKLHQLTGDPYGETKADKEKKNIKPIGLNNRYDKPTDVSKNMYRWILNNTSLLTTDATDAVRWSRIINTRNDNRYPRGEITIYRAVDNHDFDEIREGDWVTTDEKYAIQHNNMYFNGNGKVISMDVDGRDVLVSPTGNYEEAIYAPLEYSIDVKL